MSQENRVVFVPVMELQRFEPPGWAENEEAALIHLTGDSNSLEQANLIVAEAEPELINSVILVIKAKCEGIKN